MEIVIWEITIYELGLSVKEKGRGMRRSWEGEDLKMGVRRITSNCLDRLVSQNHALVLEWEVWPS